MSQSQETMLEQSQTTKVAIDKLSALLGEDFHQEEILDAASGQKQGKALRKLVSRSSHGDWAEFDDRPDPVALLKEQGESRIQELLPVRYQRMAISPFTFFRGCALIMASDLSHTRSTGIDVQVCGDAHISNFGFFASPERDIVFDINDFDETAIGPWEWDIKRLVTSVNICAEDLGLSEKDALKAVRACAEAYRLAMIDFADHSMLDVWYSHVSTTELKRLFEQTGTESGKEAGKRIGKTVAKATKKDSLRAVARLTEVVDGERRFRSEPPTLIPLRDLLGNQKEADDLVEIAEKTMGVVGKNYYESLSPDKRHLLSQYKACDLAHKIVGTGSVGLFDWVVLLQGSREDDYLVLQIKEAQESVIERFVGSSGVGDSGQRVVQGQRAIQVASDILLGWSHSDGLEEVLGGNCDVYIRQLWDCKGSIDITNLTAQELKDLAQFCGWTLAHAHARTGNRFLIAGYLGRSEVFDQAMVKFAQAYTRQNEKDYKRFMQAIESSELPYYAD